jgi:hypothetical protein
MVEDKGPESTSTIYVIKLQGYLDTEWSEWFYDMAITHESDGTTTLCGALPDQAVLHSVLERIRDMNLTLINFHKVNSSNDSERRAFNENKPTAEGGADADR